MLANGHLPAQFNCGSSLSGSGKRTSDNLDLGNAVRVTEDDTNLRRSGTLSGELADLLDDLLGGGLQPRGDGARVGDGGGGNALALAVKSTHLVGCCGGVLKMRGRMVLNLREVWEGLLLGCGARA